MKAVLFHFVPGPRLWYLLAVALLFASPASAQFMSARRMGMGGVTMLHGGPGSDLSNVAYRAVPPAQGQRSSGFSLPFGIISVLHDKPTFDTKDSTFNAFTLANLALHLPWNYPLVKPAEPEGDLTLSIARNSLAVDLGSLRDVVPTERLRFSTVVHSPAIIIGIRRAFVGIAPLVQVQNDFLLGDALRNALHEGAPFVPNTEYTFTDRAQAQAAGQAIVGAAFPLMGGGTSDNRSGVYVGARAKLLRGLAYADADDAAGFTTADTLFGDAPLDAHYTGFMRTAKPSDGGWGRGLDLGAVLVAGGFEIGLAASDLATRINWKVKETATTKDTVGDKYRTVTLAEGVPFTSKVPTTWLATANTNFGPLFVAADIRRDPLAQLSGHAGAEMWVGSLALRGGASVDSQHRMQVSGGAGLRMGSLGIDVAVATNQSNLTHERAVDLGAGLSFYH